MHFYLGSGDTICLNHLVFLVLQDGDSSQATTAYHPKANEWWKGSIAGLKPRFHPLLDD
jgi:hypothetical protein